MFCMCTTIYTCFFACFNYVSKYSIFHTQFH